MAKKKKIEKVTSITTADEYGNAKTIKLTGNTGGYTRETTPALSAVSNTTQDIKKSEPIQSIRTIDTLNNNKNLIDNAKMVAKGGASGVLSGVTGIADVPFQEAQRQIAKGKKNKTQEDIIKNAAIDILRASIPGVNQFVGSRETSKEIQNIWKDKNKSVLKKIINTGLAALGNEGLDDTYEGIKGALRFAGATNPNLDKKVAKIQSVIDKPSETLQQNVAEEVQNYGGATQFLTNAGQIVGNMAPSIAATAITKSPDLGLALMGTSAKGQSIKEALQSGADIETANRIGTAKGLTEVGTELMTGGLKIFGKGAADDVIENVINKKIGKKGLNFLAKQIAGVGGEVAEETVSDVIGTLIDKGTIDPNANYSMQDWLNTLSMTGATTLILNAITGGYTPKAYRQNALELQEYQRGLNENNNNINDNNISNTNQIREIIEQKENGQIDAEEANNRIADVQNGTYQQNQNNEVVIQEAQRQFDAIQQAEDAGVIDSTTANQERQALTNTINQMPQQDVNIEENKSYEQQDANMQEQTQQKQEETENQSKKEVVEKAKNKSQTEVIKHKQQDTGKEGRGYKGIFYDNEKYDTFSDKEIQRMGDLNEKHKKGETLTYKEKQEVAYLKRKLANNKEITKRKADNLKNPELNPNIKSYNDIQDQYKIIKQFNPDKFDSTIVDKAKEIVQANKQGRRTKQQWLDVAKNIGMQADNLDSKSLEKLAFESWAYTTPNQKETLNRQGQKMVKFDAYEWVKAVYEGARVGEQLENKVETSKEQEVQQEPQKETTQEPTKENNAIVKSNGQVITAPIETKGKNKLANIEININDGGNGNNGGNNNVNTKQGNNNIGNDAQILENYKDRKANKKASLREQASELMHSAVRAIFDRGEIIDRIGKAHNDNQLYSLYDMTFTSDSTADFNIGGMKESYQSNLSGEKIGESLENCWKPVEDAGLVRDMNKYLYELHNIDRWQQLNEDGSRKYVFSEEHSDAVSRENIKELLEIHPELEELSKPILQYQKNLLNILVESGEVSQATADYLNKTYKNYVPTWRDVESINNNSLTNDKGNLTIDNQIKTAKGSNLDLLPLKEVQAQMTKNIFKSAKMNVFGQQLYKDIGDLNKLKEIGMKGLKEQYLNDNNFDETNKKAFLKAGEEYLEEYLKDFAPNNIPVEIDKGQKTMTVYFNGEKVKMPINNEIVTALKATKPNNKLAKTLSKINDFKRGVITQYNPGFSISNALKDAPDAVLNSKYGKEYPAEYARTVKEMLGRGLAGKDLELFNQYCALGGMSNTIFDSSEGFKTDSTAKKIVGFLPNTISEVNDIIEQIPRFTEFKLTLKNGGTLSEAMYNAAEVTTNFKRGGTVTKALDAYGTTFLNASTSGFYKQIRNIIEQPNGVGFLKFAGKAMALGLTPAIINSLIYASPFGDEEEKKEAKEAYESLRQFEKDDYLLWYTGDGKFLKIPKGRAVSIPAIVYNAALNKAKGKNVSLKEVLTSIMNQTGPNNPLTDNAILSLAQTKLFDKESQGTSWSGSPIESSYMQTLRPGERYDSKTDEFSKWLGGKLNVSPKKINYLLQQNTGILGDMVLPYITSKSTGESLASRGTNFLTRRFRTDTVTSNNTTEEFYNNVTKYSQNAKSSNPKYATEKNKIRNAYLNNKSSEIAELRKEIEEINSDKTISKDEKYKQTRELYKQINKIAKDANKSYKEVKKQGDYAAIVGGNVYVENDYGKWKKESEQTKEKRDSLGLNAEDYYYYKKDEAFTKPDGKQTTLVDGDKAKEKIALVDAFGFDPSDYLEYSYNINQIKEGKNTKSKVFEYINGLNITQEQKIMLMKKKYKTYRNYDNQLFNTINNSDLTLEEKESLKNFLKIGE